MNSNRNENQLIGFEKALYWTGKQHPETLNGEEVGRWSRDDIVSELSHELTGRLRSPKKVARHYHELATRFQDGTSGLPNSTKRHRIKSGTGFPPPGRAWHQRHCRKRLTAETGEANRNVSHHYQDPVTHSLPLGHRFQSQGRPLGPLRHGLCSGPPLAEPGQLAPSPRVPRRASKERFTLRLLVGRPRSPAFLQRRTHSCLCRRPPSAPHVGRRLPARSARLSKPLHFRD